MRVVDANVIVNEPHLTIRLLDRRRHDEVIVVEPRDEIPWKRLTQEIRDIAQEAIALLKAVALVKALEIFNIKVNERQRPRHRILQMERCVPHELHHIEKAGHRTDLFFTIVFQ